MAVAPGAVRLVEEPADVERLELDEGTPVAFLAQTTLSVDDWAGVRETALRRFPDMWMPGRSDLCFATTNRQAALRAIAHKADAVVVIGSANSSNTVALEKVARAEGASPVLRINSAAELPDDLHGVVGVTAGASAPEELVRAVLDRLAPREGVELVDVTDEDEYFPPPRELRDLLRAVATAVTFSLFAPSEPEAVLADDRAVAASDVLSALG